jgi:hypothetical protein
VSVFGAKAYLVENFKAAIGKLLFDRGITEIAGLIASGAVDAVYGHAGKQGAVYGKHVESRRASAGKAEVNAAITIRKRIFATVFNGVKSAR